MDSEHTSGSSKGPTTDAGAIEKNGDSIAPLTLCIDPEHESGNGTDSERKSSKAEAGPIKSSKFSHSVASSGSSSDDLFQVDLNVLLETNASHVGLHETDEDAKTLLRYDNNDDCKDHSLKPEHTVNESASSLSRVSNVNHEWQITSMQSPSIHEMDRNGCYDANRIPASIFASKPATPMDWSVASNESLFSIHIGKNSLSRDHALMMGEDHFMSGELCKSKDLHKPEALCLSREPNRSTELIKIRQASLEAKDTKKKTLDKEGKSVVSRDTDETEKNVVLNGSFNDHRKLDVEEPRSSSTKHQGDGSGSSGQPFVSPKNMKKKGACSSCHCFNFSWAFCCCTWLNCCCKRPSCHLKFPGCSWKWLSQPVFCKRPNWCSCCCKSPSGQCK